LYYTADHGDGQTAARSTGDDVGTDDGVADLGQASVLPPSQSTLRERGFDDFAEARCASFYAAKMGRPSLPPGIYFQLLLVGYFEAWTLSAPRDGARRTP
jgi:hypothetical protein